MPDAPAPTSETEVEAPRSHRQGHRPQRGEGSWPTFVLAGVIAALALARPSISGAFTEHLAMAAWFTVFVSIALQALPFLVLGVLLSGAIAVFLPADALGRWLPKHPAAAVPVAGLSGMVLPGCECASVPIAGSLMSRGLRPAIALTFLLAAPALNPIVLISTAVAFPGNREMVLARFVAAFVTAVVIGWIWLALGRDELVRIPQRHPVGGGRLAQLVAAARHDLLHAGGFLVLGSAIAATVNVLMPTEWLDTLAGNVLVAVLTLAVFAFVIAVCSEADAFLAASLSAFPPVAQLAFMVVGPVIDVKLLSMQAGVFGKRFAMLFAPLCFVVAVLSALVVGLVVL